MNSKILSVISLALLFSLTSCDKNTIVPVKKEIFSGYVQKGPFINGSSVTISELDGSLNQTGRSYSTTVAGNSGSFEQKQIELVSNYVQLKADGYYFNEVSGESSSGQLTLYAIADISQVNSANVNVLTHLEKSRVEYLVQQKGLSFAAAKKQAQKEVLTIFNLALPTDSTSESLNLSAGGDNNAILLAVSCILQGSSSTAEMSELMANIISDIKTDGTLDNASLGSTLFDNARLINLTAVRQHLVAKYAELGLSTVVIPDFEKQVQTFLTKSTYTPVKLITYPNKGDNGPNILSDSVTTVEPNSVNTGVLHLYSMKANLPLGTKLRVVLRDNKWYSAGSSTWISGAYNASTKAQEFSVYTSNTPNNLPIMFDPGTVTIEYYENDATTPTKVKQLVVSALWTAGTVLSYPKMGNNGENILNDSLQVTHAGKIYALNVNLPKSRALKVVLKGGTWVCNPSGLISLNWNSGTYDNVTKSQTFTVAKDGEYTDMSITFTSTGTYTLEYYEDGATTPTRMRTFVQN